MQLTKVMALVSCLATSNAALAQGYDVAGTDFYLDKASTQVWLEDTSNLYIEMAKSFACIISDSRPDATPNGIWTTLINETKCGISDGQSVVLGSGVYESSRASNATPQEVSVWFTSGKGARYIVSLILTQSAEDFPPYGRWSFSYYMESSPQMLGTTFTADTSPSKGFVIVNKDTDGSVVIESFDTVSEPGFSETVQGKFIFSADLETAKFIGRDRQNDGNSSSDEGHVGTTNDDVYFQVSADFVNDEIDNTSVEEKCYARDSSWKTGYRANLYDYDTGQKIPFNGAFNFTATVGGASTSGYYGAWGVWFSNDEMRPDPSSASLTITDNDGTDYELIWTTGDLTDSNGASILTSNSFMDEANGTPFTCTNNCFVGSAAVTNAAPFTYSEAASNSGLAISSNATEKYILSNAAHSEPLMLFHDVNGNGSIDVGEQPIRYDFSVDWDRENQKEVYESYSTSASGDRSWNVNIDKTMALKNSSNEKVVWKLNAKIWDHKFIAVKSDGDIYEMTPPIYAKLDYDFANNDVNGTRTVDRTNTTWVYEFEADRDVGMGCQSLPGGQSFSCEIDITGLSYNNSGDANNTETVFQFDGQQLQSMHHGGVDTSNGYILILNPKNGTILTDTTDPNKLYVVVNTEMGEFLDILTENDADRCDGIAFNSLADINLSLSDIPAETDYNFPTFSWSPPTVPADSCKVVIGELGDSC
jgi:hypothetical protein